MKRQKKRNIISIAVFITISALIALLGSPEYILQAGSIILFFGLFYLVGTVAVMQDDVISKLKENIIIGASIILGLLVGFLVEASTQGLTNGVDFLTFFLLFSLSGVGFCIPHHADHYVYHLKRCKS